MPELPEAERARALIADQALGRRIVAVEDGDSYVSRPHPPGEIAAALVGRRLTSANRIGKMLWVETDGEGPDLGLHLGMAGRIAIDEPPHERWDRFALSFDDGGRLALRDRRRLGRAVLAPDLARLGPDAALATRAEFRARVGRGRGAIKARLMDQGVIAGVGNLLADEILWQARVDPRRAAGDLVRGRARRAAPRGPHGDPPRGATRRRPHGSAQPAPRARRPLPALRRTVVARAYRRAHHLLVPERAALDRPLSPPAH